MRNIRGNIAAAIAAAAVVALGALSGCSDADRADFAANSTPHVVELYSGGQLVRHWESTGKVQNEDQSDGYYFEDAATHKLVRVSGAVVITIK